MSEHLRRRSENVVFLGLQPGDKAALLEVKPMQFFAEFLARENAEYKLDVLLCWDTCLGRNVSFLLIRVDHST